MGHEYPLKAHEYNYLGVWIMGDSDNRGSDKLRMHCRVVTILGGCDR